MSITVLLVKVVYAIRNAMMVNKSCVKYKLLNVKIFNVLSNVTRLENVPDTVPLFKETYLHDLFLTRKISPGKFEYLF